MMEYSTPIALSSQIFHCSLPLRVDAYKGCSFSCSYCFARNRGGQTRTKEILAADGQKMDRLLRRSASDLTVGTVGEFLRARIPVHFGGMSDPFQPAEKHFRITRYYLQALATHKYPTVISTRSPDVADDEVIDILEKFPVVVQFSMSTISDQQAALVEPLAPRPSSIMRAMKTLSDAGVTVTCRWQPYIVDFSPPVEEFIDAVSAAGARQVSLEHLKIPTEGDWSPALSRGAPILKKAKAIYNSLGAVRDGREFVLPASAKLPTILRARVHCHKRGIAFGAADNELQYLSDGNACCSSVDLVAGFDTVYRYTISHMIKSQMFAREIHFDESISWRPIGPIDRFLNSKSRLRAEGNFGRRDVEYYMRRKWNDLSSFSSPLRYYGIIDTGRVDASGMKIYSADENYQKIVVIPGRGL